MQSPVVYTHSMYPLFLEYCMQSIRRPLLGAHVTDMGRTRAGCWCGNEEIRPASDRRRCSDC
jgi:hypothetical protein